MGWYPYQLDLFAKLQQGAEEACGYAYAIRAAPALRVVASVPGLGRGLLGDVRGAIGLGGVELVVVLCRHGAAKSTDRLAQVGTQTLQPLAAEQH